MRALWIFIMFLDVLGCFEPACLHFMVVFLARFSICFRSSILALMLLEMKISGLVLNLQLGYPLPTHLHGNHARVPVRPSTPMRATLLVCSPRSSCWHPIYLIDLFLTHQTSPTSLPTHPFPYCYTPSTLPIPILFLNQHIHFPPACMEFHMHGHSPPIPIFSH